MASRLHGGMVGDVQGPVGNQADIPMAVFLLRRLYEVEVVVVVSTTAIREELHEFDHLRNESRACIRP